jgi:hypothetical protein
VDLTAQLDRIEAKLDMLILALADEATDEPVVIDWEGNEVGRQRDESTPL